MNVSIFSWDHDRLFKDFRAVCCLQNEIQTSETKNLHNITFFPFCLSSMLNSPLLKHVFLDQGTAGWMITRNKNPPKPPFSKRRFIRRMQENLGTQNAGSKAGPHGNGKSPGSYSVWANENLTTSSMLWEPEALAAPENLTELQNLSPAPN